MNTKEFAKLCHVEKRTLFYYDEIGILKPAYRDENGYREYDPSQAETMDSIKLLQTASFSLNEIKTILQDNEQNKLLELKKGIERTNEKAKELLTISNFFNNKLALFNEFKEENILIKKEEVLNIKILKKIEKVNGQKFNYTNFKFYNGFYWDKESLYLFSFEDQGDINLKNTTYSFFATIPHKNFRLILFIEQKRKEFNIPDEYKIIIQQVPHILYFKNDKVLIKITFFLDN